MNTKGEKVEDVSPAKRELNELGEEGQKKVLM